MGTPPNSPLIKLENWKQKDIDQYEDTDIDSSDTDSDSSDEFIFDSSYDYQSEME
jgi:hypothetical protein